MFFRRKRFLESFMYLRKISSIKCALQAEPRSSSIRICDCQLREIETANSGHHLLQNSIKAAGILQKAWNLKNKMLPVFVQLKQNRQFFLHKSFLSIQNKMKISPKVQFFQSLVEFMQEQVDNGLSFCVILINSSALKFKPRWFLVQTPFSSSITF